MGPDERAFRAHADRADFSIGAAKGQWRLLTVEWPFAVVTVRARDGTEWAFRLTLDGYPASLPTAQPWNAEGRCPLEAAHWPKGTGRVAMAFNPGWNRTALYLPCDRMALPGHEVWLVLHPEKAWNPTRGIILYLEIVHDLLASFDHVPSVRAA